jgi:RNA polymerase sigma-70 factor (ECF subfamily)
METFDEAADWRRAATGDGEAFGRIFDRHGPRVYRHALRLCGTVHDAEDLLATAFLELWRRRRDVRSVDDSVLPWLLVTVGHLALNRGRGLRRHRAFLARLPRSEQPADAAESEALRRADLDVDPALLAAIRALSPMDQKLMALVALEGYPLGTAAEALGLSDQAARSRWQRIRRRLRDGQPLTPLATDH